MTTCKIILTPTTKEPKICHALGTTSAFNLKLCIMVFANIFHLSKSLTQGNTVSLKLIIIFFHKGYIKCIHCLSTIALLASSYLEFIFLFKFWLYSSSSCLGHLMVLMLSPSRSEPTFLWKNHFDQMFMNFSQ